MVEGSAPKTESSALLYAQRKSTTGIVFAFLFLQRGAIMATYGKALREEIRVSDGAEEDYVPGSSNINLDGEDKRSRPVLSYVVLFLGLALLFSGKWIAAIIAFAVYFVVMIQRAPNGAFYQKSDDWDCRIP
jgi:hypothetical protein